MVFNAWADPLKQDPGTPEEKLKTICHYGIQMGQPDLQTLLIDTAVQAKNNIMVGPAPLLLEPLL